MKNFKTYITAVLLLLTLHSAAQCTFKNTAFNSGEYLTYNLYYNWKFVWVKRWNGIVVHCGINLSGSVCLSCVAHHPWQWQT